jgi:hypothetical protein
VFGLIGVALLVTVVLLVVGDAWRKGGRR